MGILDLQKRSRELGRIRLGQKAANGAPVKLDRFRFTSNSEALLEKVATLYGGEVQPWTDGAQQFEVISDTARVPIMIPPQPITQWYEAWRKSGCVHRCDGHTNVLTDEPCDPEDPTHIEATQKPTTRLNVVLRDVEGIGVWRVESHGWYAAIEIPDAAEFLAMAGGYVEGWLSMDPRETHGVKDGKPYTHRFMVPIIEIDVTPAELMAGRGRVAAPTLEGPAPTREIEAPDAFATYFDLIEQATDTETLGGIWTSMVAQGLVGSKATPTPRAVEFTEAFKARAAEVLIQSPPPNPESGEGGGESPHPAPTPVPDAEGVVDAELVDDDADAVWAEIVKAGGVLGMTLPDLNDKYAEWAGGQVSSEASAAELRGFLDHIQKQEAAS